MSSNDQFSLRFRMDLLILILGTLAVYVNGQQTPTITYITPRIISKIGGTIEMDCSVLFATEYSVLWVKLPPVEKCNINSKRVGDIFTGDFRKATPEICSPTPLSSNSALIIRDNRFSMRYDTASSTYTLQIKDVQKGDEAIYQCEIVIGNNNKVTKTVTLEVSRPPVITDNSTRSVQVQENSPAELFCHAYGSPEPVVSWRRENQAILPTGGVVYRGNILKIHSIKKEDRGIYYCVAENGVGKPARRNVGVSVEFPPVVSIPNERVGQALGYSAELVCNVEAYPRPSIAWIHNGIQMSSNRRFLVDNGYTATDDFVEARVRIRSLTPRELGSYYCRAKNKLAEVTKEIQVFQTYEPNCAIGLCEDFASSSTSLKYSATFLILNMILTAVL